MKSNKSKVIMLVTIILVISILVVGGTVAYLYLQTDVLKSDKELFEKYVGQTVEQIENVVDKEKVQEITKKLKENNSESKTVLTFEDDENETLSKLSVSMDIKNDNTNKKLYNDVKLFNGEDKMMEAEYMLSENSISLRLTDIVKQFLTIDNTNLEQLSSGLNASDTKISMILNQLTYKDATSSISLTDEEIKTLKDTYLKILNNNLTNSNYEKQTDVMITVNGKTVTVNSYVLTIKPEQYKKIIQQVMEQLKTDTIILNKIEKKDITNADEDENSLKQKYISAIDEMLNQLETIEYKDDLVINVYEEAGKTIRIKIEEGFYTITIDTIENEEILGVNTKIVSLANQSESTTEIDLTKYKGEYYNLAIDVKRIAEEESNTIYEIKATNGENNMKLEFSMQYSTGEAKTKAILTSDVDFVDEIEDMIILVENTNNITLNTLSEERCKQIVQTVINAANNKYAEQIAQITMLIMLNNMTSQEPPEQVGDPSTSLKEAEISSFNSKFEPYEGNDITGSNVNTLVRITLNNNTEQKEADRKVEITGDIELKTTDKAIPEIGANVGKTYTVVLSKNEETGFVDSINITEN